jgi:glycerol-3-phosphate acyltransferase PlsY
MRLQPRKGNEALMLAPTWPTAALALLLGYALGSIPFGLLFSWVAGAGDIRKVGSGNIGATNVLRTGNKSAAAATLLFDGGKGFVSVLIAWRYLGTDAALVAGFAAFTGHLFPIWLGFKGGKGVATFLGIMLALSWLAGLGTALTWIAAAVIWRVSSLSALIAAALAPLYLLMLQQFEFAALAALLAIAIFVMHRDNIRRLAAGTEPRIGATGAGL